MSCLDDKSWPGILADTDHSMSSRFTLTIACHHNLYFTAINDRVSKYRTWEIRIFWDAKKVGRESVSTSSNECFWILELRSCTLKLSVRVEWMPFQICFGKNTKPDWVSELRKWSTYMFNYSARSRRAAHSRLSTTPVMIRNEFSNIVMEIMFTGKIYLASSTMYIYIRISP